jgi:hypothetical protein
MSKRRKPNSPESLEFCIVFPIVCTMVVWILSSYLL